MVELLDQIACQIPVRIFLAKDSSFEHVSIKASAAKMPAVPEGMGFGCDRGVVAFCQRDIEPRSVSRSRLTPCSTRFCIASLDGLNGA